MVHDDLDSLEKMLEDMNDAPREWRPTNYWKYYEQESLDLIYSLGLEGFRSSRYPRFMSFGTRADSTLTAVEVMRSSKLRRVIFGAGMRLPFVSGFFKLFNELVGRYRIDKEKLLRLYYEYCALMNEEGVLSHIDDSLLGSPDLAIEIEGRHYTSSFLIYFAQYLFANAYCGFDTVETVLEIGGGYGGQAEVILKASPHTKYVNVDIPPQAYVAQQYLSACFDGQVVGYRQTRDLDEIAFGMFPEARVIVLCPWQLPKLQGPFDLFWNSASFQEMEPEVVENYSGFVKKLTTGCVYIRALERGKGTAKGEGYLGVLKPTTRDDYIRYFVPPFELVAERTCGPLEFIEPRSGYIDLIFRRM